MFVGQEDTQQKDIYIHKRPTSCHVITRGQQTLDSAPWTQMNVFKTYPARCIQLLRENKN